MATAQFFSDVTLSLKDRAGSFCYPFIFPIRFILITGCLERGKVCWDNAERALQTQFVTTAHLHHDVV
jgi:hypothetical protein